MKKLCSLFTGTLFLSTMTAALSFTVEASAATPTIIANSVRSGSVSKSKLSLAQASPSSMASASSSMTPVSTQTLKKPDPLTDGPSEKIWSIGMSLSRTNSLYVVEGLEPSASWDYALMPSIQLNKDYTLRALIEYSYDLYQEEADFGRGQISIAKSSGVEIFSKRIKLVPSTSLGFPLSKDTKATSLLFSAGVGTAIIANPDYLFSKKWGLSGRLSAIRYVHEYDTPVSGKQANNQYGFVQVLENSWNFTDKISAGFEMGHYNFITYQGTEKDFLSHGEKVGWQAYPSTQISVGHVWGKPYVSTRGEDGQSINFNLSDEVNSLVYLGLDIKI